MPGPLSATVTCTASGAGLHAYGDQAALGRVPQGVVQQVAQDLGSPVRIHVRLRQNVCCLHPESDPLIPGPGLELGDRRAGQRAQVGRRAPQRQLPGLGEREVPEVGDEPRQELRLLVDVLHRRGG